LEENDPKFQILEEKKTSSFIEKIAGWDIWKIKKVPEQEQKKIELEIC
jgi:hypothetical protein